MSGASKAAGVLALGLGLACGGCTSSMSARAELSPIGGGRPGPPLTGSIERSCPVGDCRTQRVRLVLASGEVYEGELRLLSSGVADTPAQAGGAATPTPVHRPALITLRGPQGSQMTCEVMLTPDTRRGTGVCTRSNGTHYQLQLG